MDRLRRTRVHLTDGRDGPGVEYRITYSSREVVEDEDGGTSEEFHQGVMIVEEGALDEWVGEWPDLAIQAVERRPVPRWATVPTHQWPGGLPR